MRFRLLIAAVLISSFAAAQQGAPATAKFQIRTLNLIGAEGLAPDEQDAVTADVLDWSRKVEGGVTLAGVEARVREGWQEHGFNDASVSATLDDLEPGKEPPLAVVTARIKDGGQYHLARITFHHSRVFRRDELRQVFPIADGDPYVPSKIASGMQNLHAVLLRVGYIWGDAHPYPHVDRKRHLISLDLYLDEGRRYTFGELTLRGLQGGKQDGLTTDWNSTMRGEPYDPVALERFMLDHGLERAKYVPDVGDLLNPPADGVINVTIRPRDEPPSKR